MIDDAKVQRIVTETLTRHGNDAQHAWQALYEQRNDPADPKASLDVDVAAAEHYMLARFWVGAGLYGVSQMRLLTHVYHAAKKTLPESWIRHDASRPTTPASDKALAWALKGIVDGENDRARAGIAAPSFFTAPPAYNPATEKYRAATYK